MCGKQRTGKRVDFGEFVRAEGLACWGFDDGKRESEAGGIAIGFLLWVVQAGCLGLMGWEWGGRVRVWRGGRGVCGCFGGGVWRWWAEWGVGLM